MSQFRVCLTAVSVWLEYVQFAIGGMAGEGGVQHVRDVFERAVTAVGLHVSQGANVWEAYREFENALLAGLMVSCVRNLQAHCALCEICVRDLQTHFELCARPSSSLQVV